MACMDRRRIRTHDGRELNRQALHAWALELTVMGGGSALAFFKRSVAVDRNACLCRFTSPGAVFSGFRRWRNVTGVSSVQNGGVDPAELPCWLPVIGATYKQAHWLPDTPAVDCNRAQRQVRLLAGYSRWHGLVLFLKGKYAVAQKAWPEQWEAMTVTDPLGQQRICDPWGIPLQADIATDRGNGQVGWT